jgi:membrane fusion protein (multidrug efflux system)
MVKRFVIAAILLAVVGGGLVGFNLFRAKAIQDFFATMPRPTVTVSAMVAEPVTWQPTIDAVGTVSASRGIDVVTEVAGIVREVNFKANDLVAEHQLLVQIDDRQERADIAAAEAELANEQQSLERARTLSARGVNPTSTLDDAQTAVAASQAQLERLNAILDQKAIEAAFSGTIGIPRVEAGQYVSVGTTIATLQDLSRMRVDFTVPEHDFNRLSIGQAVRVSDAISGKTFDGKVVGIDPRIDPSSRLISVRAEIANADGALQPGQFARVAVALPAEEGIMALAQTAVVTSLYGDFVYKVVPKPAEAETSATGGAAAASEAEKPDDALEVQQIFVRTGRRMGGLVEIVEGVEPGQRVVTAGQNRLSNGSPVTVDNTVDPAKLAQEEAASP